MAKTKLKTARKPARASKKASTNHHPRKAAKAKAPPRAARPAKPAVPELRPAPAMKELDGYLTAHNSWFEEALCELPGLLEGGGAFFRILDDVDDEAEVHDVGRYSRGVWAEDGIPASAGDALLLEQFDVPAMTAAIVEHARIGTD